MKNILENYKDQTGTAGAVFNATNDTKYNLGKVTNNSLENTSNTVGGCISNAQINLGYHQSMFCWVYFNSFYATASLTGILGQHRYASNQGMGLTAKYVSSTSGYLSINTGNGSDRTFNTYCGNTLLTSGKWYHVGYTYDGKTVTLYVNGNVDGTFTITDMKIVSDYIVLFAWSLNGTSGATIFGDYKLNGRLNDVRLYNHCLSLKEVKNLAKGLMLHYKLSKSGANLLKNTATEKSWTYSGTSYSDSNYSQETITPASDSYYTMSFDAKSNRNSTSNFITYLYNNNSGRQCDSVKGYIDGQLVYTGSASDGTCPMPTYTYYRHYVIVRHFNTNATALTKQNVFRIQNTGSTALTMHVKNAKIEVGDKSTPWIPNSSDTLYTQMGLNNNIESDNSGYNNNGTRINITTWNTDTARYLSSMVFNGDNGVIKLPFDPSSFWIDFTISVWIYKTSIGTKNYQTIFGGPSGFELEARNNAETNPVVVLWNWGKGSGAYEFNKWNHVVMTRTSSETKLYINGTQVATGTAGTIPSGDYFVGAWNTYNAQNFEGRMSDFRIYSTALSSEDVLELYHTCACIDKNDSIHCYELMEN